MPVKRGNGGVEALGGTSGGYGTLACALQHFYAFKQFPPGNEAGHKRGDVFGKFPCRGLRLPKVAHVREPAAAFGGLGDVDFLPAVQDGSRKVDGFVDGVHRAVGDALDHISDVIEEGKIIVFWGCIRGGGWSVFGDGGGGRDVGIRGIERGFAKPVHTGKGFFPALQAVEGYFNRVVHWFCWPPSLGMSTTGLGFTL